MPPLTRTGIGGIGGGRDFARGVGDPTGVQINTKGMDAIIDRVDGPELASILEEAIVPAFFEARADWPVRTGASRDSMRVETTEVTARSAHVSIVVGGVPLINDPRNSSNRDYAPFIEADRGIIAYAVITNLADIKAYIKMRVKAIMRESAIGQ